MSSHDFGKQALRNSGATSHRTPLILNHEAFEDLIKNPFVKTVHPRIARTTTKTGYWLLDVRYAEEHDDHPNSRCRPRTAVRLAQPHG